MVIRALYDQFGLKLGGPDYDSGRIFVGNLEITRDALDKFKRHYKKFFNSKRFKMR